MVVVVFDVVVLVDVFDVELVMLVVVFDVELVVLIGVVVDEDVVVGFPVGGLGWWMGVRELWEERASQSRC